MTGHRLPPNRIFLPNQASTRREGECRQPGECRGLLIGALWGVGPGGPGQEWISYSVNQRVQEIGVRMALGASPADLQRRILLGTFGLTVLGLALGIAASRALSYTLGSLLFGVDFWRSDYIFWRWRAADRGCGSSRIYSSPARLADRSNGCAAVELNTTILIDT